MRASMSHCQEHTLPHNTSITGQRTSQATATQRELVEAGKAYQDEASNGC